MSGERDTTRIESDTMGKMEIPGWAYWGAQTQRAVENFAVSDKRIPVSMIKALGLIKRYVAEANRELALLDKKLADAVCQAADEVIEGRWNQHFPIDVFQTGSGTSWNMNANEVISNRANEILGAPLGTKNPVHPNDHVNKGQSSNDVIPTAIHIADRLEIDSLIEALLDLQKALETKAEDFKEVIKIGRTHLQDAVPMTLGQEFEGYTSQIGKSVTRVKGCLPHLEELALGGTAIGTGLNAHPEMAGRAIGLIAAKTGVPFRTADSLFEAIGSRDAQVELMGALNTVAVTLMKIANDLRLLASGPRAGFGEIVLPSLQPGSSIMPGKVNPVIPEMVIQAAAHVMGKHYTVSIGAQNAPLELNMMNPLIGYETLASITLLANTCNALAERCIRGLEADEERCAYWIEWSLALVTPLATKIGYDKAAALAHKAYKSKRTIREIVRGEKIFSDQELDELLDPKRMI